MSISPSQIISYNSTNVLEEELPNDNKKEPSSGVIDIVYKIPSK